MLPILLALLAWMPSMLGSELDQQAPTLRGQVSGEVLDSADGTPVYGAIVTLYSTASDPIGADAIGLTTQQQVLTDPNGRYVFLGLPGGTYRVAADVRGFGPGWVGQTRHGGPAQDLHLTAGQAISGARVRVWRGGAISGSVVDERGEAVTGVEVWALQRRFVAGQLRFLPIGLAAVTDDLGHYRLYQLPPGTYAVAVRATSVSLPASIASAADDKRVASELAQSGGPQTSGSWLSVRDSRIQLSGGVSQVLVPPRPKPGDWLAYQTTFYPNVPSIQQASSIPIASGSEQANVTIQVVLAKSSTVEGRVIRADGSVVPNTGVRLVPASAEALVSDSGFETSLTATDQTGRFLFVGVPPGDYRLRVLRRPRRFTSIASTVLQLGENTVSGVLPGPSAAAGEDETEYGDEVVSVGAQPTTGSTLILRPGVSVTGRVVLEPTSMSATPAQLPADASITLTEIDGHATRYFPRIAIQPDGTFKTAAYPPGRYFVTFRTNRRGFILKSAAWQGRDISRTAVHLGADGVSGVVVTLAATAPSLSGVVRDTRGQPQPQAAVLLLPVPTDEWVTGGMNEALLRIASTAADGSFRMEGLPPGKYSLLAVDDASVGDLRNPDYVGALARMGRALMITEGQQRESLEIATAPTIGQASRDVSGRSADESSMRSPPPQPSASAERTTSVSGANGPPRSTGRVVSATLSRPIARAIVEITDLNGKDKWVDISDADGGFPLPAGPDRPLRVCVSRIAYLSECVTIGMPAQDGSRGAADSIVRSPADVTIRMTKGAAIEGTVVDPHGRPQAGLQVSAVKVLTLGGERRLVPAASRRLMTDDRGFFRLYGLGSGSYLISASWAGADYGGALRQFDSLGPPLAYVPIFHPGTPSALQAQAVHVAAEGDRRGVDVVFEPTRTAGIRGQVDSSSGTILTNVLVRAFQVVPGAAADIGTPLSARATDGGTFVLDALAPGSYVVVATGSSDVAADRKALFWGSAAVTLSEGQSASAHVLLGPTVRVCGDVSIEQTSARTEPAPAVTTMRLVAEASPGTPVLAPRPAAVRADGSFCFLDVVAGRYRVEAGGDSRSAPNAWRVTQLTSDGQARPDAMIEIGSTRDAPKLLVAVRSALAYISGDIVLTPGATTAPLCVVAFPVERALRSADTVRSGCVDERRHFSIDTSSTGDVFVGLSSVADGRELDDQVLDTIATTAVRLQLQEGRTSRLSIAVGPQR